MKDRSEPELLARRDAWAMRWLAPVVELAAKPRQGSPDPKFAPVGVKQKRPGQEEKAAWVHSRQGYRCPWEKQQQMVKGFVSYKTGRVQGRRRNGENCR